MSRAQDNTVRVTVSAGDGGRTRATLTVLSPNGLGRVIELNAGGTVLGRNEEATVTVEDESMSRQHARFLRIAGAYLVEDLGSTNGTFVNGERIASPTELADGARIQLGLSTFLRFSLQDETEYHAARQLYETTVRDALTGAFNRHYLEERLTAEFAYAKRHGSTVTMLFVDVDHFKRVNDTHGHPAGDEVLRAIAKRLLELVRTEDMVARYGGEEFVVMVRGIAENGVTALAERLRAEVQQLAVAVAERKLGVTVSVGVATIGNGADFEAPAELLAAADAALYRAKSDGRNCVRFA